jgi:endonuclease I
MLEADIHQIQNCDGSVRSGKGNGVVERLMGVSTSSIPIKICNLKVKESKPKC